MNQKDFKYDVAFSFLDEDEEVVTQINDLIKDRLKTFVYSERQADIAGTDGELIFNQVFGSEARIVCVLHREKWGKTKWTRIEETAIHSRGFDEGYDFVIFALLDKCRILPKWLPKNGIWMDLERYGIKGMVNAIEIRVRDAGGEVKEETAAQSVIRTMREIDAEKKRKHFIDSPAAVQAAKSEVDQLFNELQEIVNQVSGEEEVTTWEIKISLNKCAVRGRRFSIFLNWEVPLQNSLESSAFYVYLYKGDFILPGEGRPVWTRATKLKEFEFNFDINEAGSYVWRDVQNNRCRSTGELAKFVVTKFLEKIREAQIHAK